MKLLRMLLLLATFGLATTSALAGRHHVCYQSPSEGRGSTLRLTGVYACHDDAGGRCSIAVPPGAVSESTAFPLPPASGSPSGAARMFRFDSVIAARARIQFWNAGNASATPDAVRDCTIALQDNTGTFGLGHFGPAEPAAELVGYTSDASGLVSTAVWRKLASSPRTNSSVTVKVPFDFVVTGGGAVGTESPNGALLYDSAPVDEVDTLDPNRAPLRRQWRAGALNNSVAEPMQAQVYAIAMKIEGVSIYDLRAWLLRSQSVSPGAVANPNITQPVAYAQVALGGGATAHAPDFNTTTPFGQYLTQSAPGVSGFRNCDLLTRKCTYIEGVIDWRVESKDHAISRPGAAQAWLTTLPASLTIGGVAYQVVNQVVYATSGETAHPSVDVSGLKGQFALTGVGASVDWKRFDSFGNLVSPGNLLWRLQPRPDLGGASVASKDHLFSSPARITAFALGIKLVR